MSRKSIILVLSLLMIAAFFMPWFLPVAVKVFAPKNLLPNSGAVAGFEVYRYKNFLVVLSKGKTIMGFLKGATPKIYYIAYLIPVLAAMALNSAISGRGSRAMAFLAGVLPLAGFVAMFIQFNTSLVKHMTYGGYATVVCSLGLVLAGMGVLGKGK